MGIEGLYQLLPRLCTNHICIKMSSDGRDNYLAKRLIFHRMVQPGIVPMFLIMLSEEMSYVPFAGARKLCYSEMDNIT